MQSCHDLPFTANSEEHYLDANMYNLWKSSVKSVSKTHKLGMF